MRAFFRRALRRVQAVDIGRQSVMIAYYLLLSLPPLLLTVGAVLPYFHIDPEMVSPYIEDLLPEQLLEAFRPILDGLLTQENGGLLSLGILATLWSASKGVNAIMVGVDRAYCSKETRHFITSRIASIGVLVLMVVVLIALMVAFGFGERLIDFFAGEYHWAADLKRTLNAIKWPLTLLTIFIMLVALYRLTPHIKTKVGDVWVGALAATIGFLVLVQLFSVYLSFSARSLTAYGVLSAIFLLMIFLRLIGYILLLGAVINATLFEGSCTEPSMKNSRIDRAVVRLRDRFLG